MPCADYHLEYSRTYQMNADENTSNPSGGASDWQITEVLGCRLPLRKLPYGDIMNKETKEIAPVSSEQYEDI